MALSYLTCNSCYMYMQAWGCIVNNTVNGLWSSWLKLHATYSYFTSAHAVRLDAVF